MASSPPVFLEQPSRRELVVSSLLPVTHRQDVERKKGTHQALPLVFASSFSFIPQRHGAQPRRLCVHFLSFKTAQKVSGLGLCVFLDPQYSFSH